MSWNKTGRWVLLVGSLALGLAAGWVGFWIFELKVPTAVVSRVTMAEARLYYMVWGAVLGLVIFVWTLVASLISKWTAARPAPAVADGPPRSRLPT